MGQNLICILTTQELNKNKIWLFHSFLLIFFFYYSILMIEQITLIINEINDQLNVQQDKKDVTFHLQFKS